MSANFISVEGLAKRFPEPGGKGELTVFDNVHRIKAIRIRGAIRIRHARTVSR